LGNCWANRLAEDFPHLVTTALEQPRSFTDLQLTMGLPEFVALLSKPDRKKILLASTPAVLRNLHGQLDPKNYFSLHLATDGREALFKAVALQPDLILASAELPLLKAEDFTIMLEMLAPSSKLILLAPHQDPRLLDFAAKNKQIAAVWNTGQCMADRRYFQDSVDAAVGISDRDKEKFDSLFKLVDSMALSGHSGHDDLMDDPTLFQDFDDIDLD
jgi:CheY-like chemotaxis protein